MLTNASDLPPEIWCHIGQFILPADRPNLALVNRTLYGIVASDLYSHVEVISRNPTTFVHAFQALKSVCLFENELRLIYDSSQEQDLANRLRKLTIWIHALNEVIHIENPPFLPDSTTPRKQRIPENRLRLGRSPFLGYIFGRKSLESTKESPRAVQPMNKHELFMGVLAKLENLKDLVLVWRLDEGYNKTSPTTCRQLVSDIWRGAGNNICSLTLDMAMFNLYEALRCPPELGALEELHIRITLEKHGSFRGNAARILIDTVIPFINRLTPQLTAFSLTSLCNLNLDPLFYDMNSTPLLRRLFICLAFQVSNMWNPNALQTFLRNHSTIQHLTLRYAECCSDMFRHNWTIHDRVLIGEAFTGQNAFNFPQLESVTLGLQFRLSDNLRLGDYVSRFSGSVSCLKILDRSLTFVQVRRVLEPFRQGTLKSLDMFVAVFTPELLCFIASLLPALHDLTLHVERFSNSRLPLGVSKSKDAAVRFKSFHIIRQ